MPYELLDSGEGEKLERVGEVVMRRPDPEALWHKADTTLWEKATLTFDRVDSKTGVWRKKPGSNVPGEWTVEYGDLRFIIRPTSFKHIGIFPEQIENWKFISEVLSVRAGDMSDKDSDKARKKPTVLNLFAYTGGATLAAAKAGAEVTHVDASKPVVEWAKENAALNSLSHAPIRWIVDDALAFAKREVKRGKKYDAIVMDPPAFGRGPDGETWKIEENFLELFDVCHELLADDSRSGPHFFIISGYASGYSATAFENCLKTLEKKFGGKTESFELLLKENSSRNVSLPAGVTARWRTS